MERERHRGPDGSIECHPDIVLKHTVLFDILRKFMRSRTVIFVLFFLLPFLLSSEGCVILNPVGDAISTGFENTLTYFNIYYNASKAFHDAESAIREAKKANELKGVQGTQDNQIPADAQKNLDLVIDKCSNILAFHSKSSYVDDALMMTGKAFYYKREYAKAERKFLELISQYPKSSLNLDAQLWCARSQEKMEEYDAALKTATTLAGVAEQQQEKNHLAGAYYVMGSLSVHSGAIAPAIESFEKSAQTADDDQLKATAWQRAGELYFDDGQYENAIHASEQVLEYSDDVYQLFQSKLRMTRSYRNLERPDKALAVDNEMVDDYRFKDLLGPILLERAKTLMAGGREREAIDLFRRIDTTYARTEASASADYELGTFFRMTVGDYSKAREYYSKAMAVPGTSTTEQSTRMVNVLTRYLESVKQISIADSLSSFIAKPDSGVAAQDSASLATKDSSTAAKDSVKSAARIPAKAITQDSLDAMKARAGASLGELFYTDLANPDSAVAWLRYALTYRYDRQNAPRMLYMLAELANTYPDKTKVTAKEYEDQLIRDFPDSYFARQLQNVAPGTDVEEQKTDSAAVAYAIADSLIAAGENGQAIVLLQTVIADYPSSPQAAKSRYAIGWIYENRLSKMDSAAAQYKMLLSEYPSTPFAKVISGRQLDTLATVQSQTNSLPSDTTASVSRKDTTQAATTTQLNTKSTTMKPPGTLSRRARILQSTQGKQMER